MTTSEMFDDPRVGWGPRWTWFVIALVALPVACTSKAPEGSSTPLTGGSGGGPTPGGGGSAGSGGSGAAAGSSSGGIALGGETGGTPGEGGGTAAGGATGAGAPGSGGTTDAGGVTTGDGGSVCTGGKGGGAGSGTNGPLCFYTGGFGGGTPCSGAGTGGAPPEMPKPTSACYSPGQNLDHAYDDGAVGCRCTDPSASLCVGSLPRTVGLVCSCGHWVAVRGPCETCWTAEQAEHVFSDPTIGCACPDGPLTPRACAYTQATGYTTLSCDQGHFRSGFAEERCTCKTDAQCGLGSKCVDSDCLPGVCEVDGVTYGAGVGNIPDPFSCNTCTCNADGTLACTEKACPVPCPAGTVAGHSCFKCGIAGGCAVTRTGCLAQCKTDADCPDQRCDTATHVCTLTCR